MQKVPHLEGFSSNCSKLFRVVYKASLADAKMFKYVMQRFLRGNLVACNFGEYGDSVF